jgi:hypothetical protein
MELCNGSQNTADEILEKFRQRAATESYLAKASPSTDFFLEGHFTTK